MDHNPNSAESRPRAPLAFILGGAVVFDGSIDLVRYFLHFDTPVTPFWIVLCTLIGFGLGRWAFVLVSKRDTAAPRGESHASVIDSGIGTDVTLGCSGLTRALLILGIPVLIAVAFCLAGVLLWFLFMPARQSQHLGSQNLIAAYLLFPVLIALFVWAISLLVRYRESLFTTFRFSAAGIVVQNSRYGELVLHWHDVAATYSAPAKMIVLRSPKLAKPLAVMSFGGSAAPEFIAARTMIRLRIGDRWKQRWLV